MQCKDIPDGPILEYLSAVPFRDSGGRKWAFLGPRIDLPFEAWFVMDVMPAGVSVKLARAKMAQLVKRGLVSGCTCGCRGDFVITGKGIVWLELAVRQHKQKGETE